MPASPIRYWQLPLLFCSFVAIATSAAATEMDFSGANGAVGAIVSTVQDSKLNIAGRADIVTMYNACRSSDPEHSDGPPYDLGDPQHVHSLQGDELNFTTIAIARLELAKQNMACSERLTSPDALVESVNNALISQADSEDWVLGTTCDPGQNGDKSFAVRGLVTMIYRYRNELQQTKFQDPGGEVITSFDRMMDFLKRTVSGSPDGVPPTYRCGLWEVHPLALPETENHLLMIHTSRYLTNQLLGIDNQANDYDDFMLRYLRSFLQNDFSEYNSRPYQTQSMMALQNLFDFACDPDVVTFSSQDARGVSCGHVKTAAQMVLDYISAKFAVSSNGLRRLAPYRRRVSHYGTDFFPKVPGDHPEGDPQTFRFMVLTGMPSVPGIKYQGRVGADIMQLAAVTTYKVPDMILDLMINKSNPYFQRFRHLGAEQYSGSDAALLTASGKHVSVLCLAKVLSVRDVVDPLGFSKAFSPEEHGCDDDGPTVPTTLMPSALMPVDQGTINEGTGTDADAFIQLLPTSYSLANSLCVAPSFACGGYVLIPKSYLGDRCFTTVDEEGHANQNGPWWFIDASGNCDGGQKLGIFIAIFAKRTGGQPTIFGVPLPMQGPPVYIWDRDRERGQTLAEAYNQALMNAYIAEDKAARLPLPSTPPVVPGVALLEVTASDGMKFPEFQENVRHRNASLNFNNDPFSEKQYETSTGTDIRFIIGGVFGSYYITKLNGSGETSTAPPLAEGDVLNSCEQHPCQAGDGHNGRVTITNRSLRKRLVLDFAHDCNPDRCIPHRTEQCWTSNLPADPFGNFWAQCPPEIELLPPSPNSGAFTQSRWGKSGNFELIVGSGDYALHYWRDNDAPGTPWHLGGEMQQFQTIIRGSASGTSPPPRAVTPGVPVPSTHDQSPGDRGDSGAIQVQTAPPPPGQSLSKSQSPNTGYAVSNSAQPTSIAVIQSNMGNPGDLVAVVRMSPKPGSPDARIGDFLVTYVFDSASRQWQGPDRIIADGLPITGVTGAPGLIQSTYGSQGHFVLLVPQGPRVVFYWRDNDSMNLAWHRQGPIGTGGDIDFYSQAPVTPAPLGVALLQSNFGTPGDLVAIVLMSPPPAPTSGSGGRPTEIPTHDGGQGSGTPDGSDYLVTYVLHSGEWSGPTPLVADEKRITGVTGAPAAIQGRCGTKGNFELLVPQGDHVMHYWRANDSSGFPWQNDWHNDGPIGKESAVGASSTRSVTGRRDTPSGVALIESNIGSPGDFVAAVRMSPWSPISTSGGGGDAVRHQGEFTTSGVPDYMGLFQFSCGSTWQGTRPTPILVDGKPANGISAF